MYEDIDGQQRWSRPAGPTGRGRIHLSLGILMERHGIDEGEAFRLLMRMAQQQGRRVHAVADELVVVRTGVERAGEVA